MKKVLAIMTAAVLLAACSTNPDGSINWGDNPVNHAAGKIEDGLNAVNRALTPKEQAASNKAAGIRSAKAQKQKKPNDLLDQPVYSDMSMTYREMLNIGYIRKNPDYPKYSDKPFVLTSVNCADGYGCHRPSRYIAPRP